MNLSLSKLPWHTQIAAFVLVAGGAVFGFWNFYVTDMNADIQMRQTRLNVVRADIAKGLATARRLNDFRAQVADLEQRLESLKAVLPEQKDVADILRRVQGLATQSNLTIQRFTPQPPKAQALYAELPYKLQAEGTYHNLGAFFDKVSKFHRIINVSEISIKAKPQQTSGVSIVAECVATTFVLQEGKPAAPVAPVAR
jgi:type IV pilus assembly protein PilO